MPKSKSSDGTHDDEDDAHKRGIWLGNCRYDVVLRVAMEHNYKLVGEMDLWYMSWTDCPLSAEKISEMKRLQNLVGTNSPPIQKINHFPGMYEICRKDRLGRNLNRLKKIFPKDYELFPLTWDLPADMTELQDFGKRHKNCTYIVKPDSGCQGKGIFLVKNLRLLCPFAKCVCQLYVTQPFLIDGYKFDQRIYVLLTCVDPLRVYIYNEGIARFATVKYQMPCDANLDVTYMHLTNYSVNKFSNAYDPEYGGTKRPLSTIYTWMTDHGYDVPKLQRDIDDIVVKTIVCVAPNLRHNYRATFPKREKGCYCFEVLGFDILVDRHMKPMLIEVNHSPSFSLDTEVDNEVKIKMIRNVFDMMYMGNYPPGSLWRRDPSKQEKYNIKRRPGTPYASTIPDTLKDQFAYEEMHQKDFRLIFSEENPGKYARFMDKEYFVMDYEDKMFIKKKIEPRMFNGMTDYPQSRQNMHTAIRQNQLGQMYVETRTGTPNTMNPHEFLKFKYNENASTPQKKLQKQFRLKKKTLFDINNPPEESLNETDDEDEDVCDQERKARVVNADKIFRQRDVPKLTPSQRVQNALEQLRRKNVEKFKLITRQNTAMLKSYTSTMQAVEEQRAAYIKAVLKTDKSPQRKVPKLQTSAEELRNRTSRKPDESVLRLDSAKLPFIFQQMKDTQRNNFRDSHGPSSAKSVPQTSLDKWLSKISNTVKSKILPKESDRINRNVTFSSKSISSTVLDSFKPINMDVQEESRRRKTLSSRKRAIKILGIGETAQQIVRMVAAPDRKDL